MSKLTEPEFGKATEFTFNHFDKNKSGFIDKQEISNLIGAIAPKLNFPVTQQLMDAIYQRIDQDKDNRISYNDFHSTLRHYYFNN